MRSAAPSLSAAPKQIVLNFVNMVPHLFCIFWTCTLLSINPIFRSQMRTAMLLDTPICDFGWKAPDFTLKDAHGTSFTMSDQLGEKGLLVAFICNHCPYVQAIGDRL
ncbi:MAG: redoxin domain-containing protein, partial [Roseibium sp.]